MKIGILTYHRSHNYGALLQTIALRKVLEDMGHQATFIDYWPAYHRHMYALFSFSAMMEKRRIRPKWRYLKKCLTKYSIRKKRRQSFDDFIANYIMPYLSPLDGEYDLIVHGSDQIWRKQPEMRTYNPVYFGRNDIRAGRKISYAASMGVLPEDQCDIAILKDYLQSLDKISVRESDLKRLVVSLVYPCEQHLDPTLLLTGDEWASLMDIRPTEPPKRYVLFYNLMPDSFDIKGIEAFAAARGLELRILYSEAVKKNSEKEITTADPKDFLSLVYHADFVFTSSFHGLAFSLLFGKQFYAAFKRNSGRAESLLEQLGIPGRLLQPMGIIPEADSEIDYVAVYERMKELRNFSLQYLKDL